MLYGNAVELDPVDVSYNVEGIVSWYRGLLDRRSGTVHSDKWVINFWEADGMLESTDEVRLSSRDVRMVDNGTASSDDIVSGLVSEIVVEHGIVYTLPGVPVQAILESVRRTYVTESDAFVQSLLRIVKQGVVHMIHTRKLMLSHEKYVFESGFVSSTEDLDYPTLRTACVHAVAPHGLD